MELVSSFLIAVGAGVCVGLLSGLLGIGGGVLMVPLFRLGFSLEAVMATATSLFCIMPTSCSGAITHIRNKTCLPRVGVALGIGGALLSPVGAWLADRSPSLVIILAMAAVILYSATTMVRKALAVDGRGSGVAGADAKGAGGDGGDAAEDLASFASKKTLACIGVGALAGFCSGFVGVGGGFIMVPMMMSLFKVPMSKASGTSLIAIGIIAIPAVIAQAAMGNVDFVLGLAVVLGSIPGAFAGARLVKRFSEKHLRLFFAAVLMVSAVVLVANELGLMI